MSGHGHEEMVVVYSHFVKKVLSKYGIMLILFGSIFRHGEMTVCVYLVFSIFSFDF